MADSVRELFDPETMEARLAELQAAASPGKPRELLFTLIVVHDEEGRGQVEQALDGLVGMRAARIIRLDLSPHGRTRISLSARCSVDAAKRGVCFQEVIVENGTDDAGCAPGTWGALVVRDLPVVAWWAAPLEGREGLLDVLLDRVDKVLIDSEALERRGAGLEGFMEWLGRTVPEARGVLADMAWARYRPVRAQVARACGERWRVWREEGVRLRVAAPSEAGARLLAGWVCSRLGWGGREPGVALEWEGGAEEVRVAWEGRGGGREEVRAGAADLPEDAAILAEECENPVSDPLYREALRCAGV
ncbi:glucose-6-phosphate dehydrogenase assembly protein OpcA [Spirochaeta thermophila]|nr:glucose-6-phosphate dehydrogenase assembly protein OpcA [Spirochaeta thermophila]